MDQTMLLAGGAAVALVAIGGAVLSNMGGSSESSTVEEAAPEEPEPIDVSIPYNSAARVAYDQWRVENKKGGFDKEGFAVFEEIYTEATIGMVAYKKMERDLALKKASYEAIEKKLETLENGGWSKQPQSVL